MKKKEKSSPKEVIDGAMKLALELTDQRFKCYISSDDGGSHLVCAIERDEYDVSDIKGHLPSNFMGWRSVILSVPNNYIDIFLDNKSDK